MTGSTSCSVGRATTLSTAAQAMILLFGGEGGDIMDGGPGQSTVSYATAEVAVEIALLPRRSPTGDGFDHLWNIENVVGSSYGDVITGDANINRLDAGSGGTRWMAAPDGAGSTTGRRRMASASTWRSALLRVTVPTASSGFESVISPPPPVLVGDAQENCSPAVPALTHWSDGGEGFDVASFELTRTKRSPSVCHDPATPRLGSAAGEGNRKAPSASRVPLARASTTSPSSAAAVPNGSDGGVGADSLNGLSGCCDIFVFGPASGRDQVPVTFSPTMT